ncbi:MAG: hypothetical protein V9G13_13920 [Marmoricola sp.]
MKRLSLFIPIVLAVLIVSIAVAQSGGGYDLTWSTIDGGGGASSGGGYTVDGTLGQFEAGALSGGSYTLSGGFWTSPAATPQFVVYLPLVLR